MDTKALASPNQGRPADADILGDSAYMPAIPGGQTYAAGGRPGLEVDFRAVCEAVQGTRNSGGEIVPEVAVRFGVGRGWIWKWLCPALKGTEKGEEN